MKKTKEVSGSTAGNNALLKLVEDLQKNNETLISAHKEFQVKSLKQLIIAKRLLGIRLEMVTVLADELSQVRRKLLELLLKASIGRLSNEALINDLNILVDSIGERYNDIDWETKVDAVDKFSENIMEDFEREAE